MKKATRQQTKAHNTRLILKTVYDQGQISRADVSRLTGLTRTTVSDIVSELIKDGLVDEVGHGPSAGGKPPILLSVVEDSRHLIGIDLASGEFRGAVTNLRGKIKHRVCVPIDDQDGETALNRVYELIEQLIEKRADSVLGVGIGTPGLVNAQQRVVLNAVNLDWRNLPLGKLLEERFHLPIYIANDCQVAALAECTFGGCKKVSNLVLINIGHGVGAGIVLNRKVYFGDGFGAGEIGHIVVVEDGEPCRCGHRGCLETVICSRSLVRRVRQMAQDDPTCFIHHLIDTPDKIEFDTVLQAFQAGDQAVCDLVCQAGIYLGDAIASLVGALNIHCVVIAGEISRFGEKLVQVIRQQVDRKALTPLVSQTQIKTTTLGSDIVLLGAASLLLSRTLGIV